MITLRPFQREGVRAIYDFGGRALLADDQGLGKTAQALEWIRRIPKRRPVAIVVPCSLKYLWQVQAMLHFGIRVEVLNGTKPRKSLPGDIVVLNYDILSAWLPCLLKHKVKVVIFDECQFIKNISARRTKASARLAGKADSVLGLSGTPLTNRPVELWPVLSMIRPSIFPQRLDYLWRYCQPRHTRWGWKFDGAAHLGELHRILRERVMIRRLKKNVLPELPDKVHEIVPFRLAKYDEYNQALGNFLAWLRKISPAKAQRAKKSQALVKLGYLLRLCARLKLKWTERWIRDYEEARPGAKLVGMSMNTFVIEHLARKFPNSVVVNGKVVGRHREEAVRRFQTSPRCQYFWGNWRAAGVGLTLTASNVLVSLDFPWTPGDLVQGQDRIHRIGQKKKVIIYHLMLLDTVEENVFRGLQKKQSILDAVLDGGKAVRDFSVLDLVLKELSNEL